MPLQGQSCAKRHGGRQQRTSLTPSRVGGGYPTLALKGWQDLAVRARCAAPRRSSAGRRAGGLLLDHLFNLGGVYLDNQHADVLALGKDGYSDLDLVHFAAVVELGRPLPGLPGREGDIELG